MGMSRYMFTGRVKVGDNDLGTISSVSPKLYQAANTGLLKLTTRMLVEGERLDTIAASVYGESTYWWIIAAASGIGWSLQVPPGTYLVIPTDLSEVFRYIQ